MRNPFLKAFSFSKLLPRIGRPRSVPGTVTYVGKKRETRSRLHLIDYTEKDISEASISTVAESLPFLDKPSITWLDITGVHDEEVIHDIGRHYNVHPLTLEDIANTTQRSKVEEYEDYLFVVMKMAYYAEDPGEVMIEQVSLVIGKNYVISFQEIEGDVLDELRDRIRSGRGRIRRLGSDYLMYAIMDSIVDHYFTIMEKISDEIEGLEEMLLLSADQDLLNRIYGLRQELIFLRKSIWPAREVMSLLMRTENDFVTDSVTMFLRDMYDHTVQAIETVETFREMVSAMLDLYLSTVSNRMNEVMKVLTIFAALFIPLTFLAGVYGMNFKFMPEINMRLAYPLWWAAAAVITVLMLIYFKRKKWL